MADALLIISAIPGASQKVGIKAYETNAPTVEVASVQFDPPHTSERQIIVPGLNPVPHIFKIFTTPGFPTMGTLIHEFWMDVRNNQVTRERIYFVVGRGETFDPNAGDLEYINPYLDGKTVSGVFQRMTGYLLPGNEFQLLPGGGFSLTNGQVFQDEDTWMIEIDYVAAANPNPIVALFGDVVDLVADTVLDFTHRKKVMNCMASSLHSSMKVTMESLASIPEGSYWYFIMNEGTNANTIVKTQPNEYFYYRNKQVTSFIIAQGEKLWIHKKGLKFHVLNASPGILQVGELVFSYSNEVPNALLNDAALRNGNAYRRVFEWIKSQPLNYVVFDPTVQSADWQPAEGKQAMYHYYENGEVRWFRLPNQENLFPRALKDFNVRGIDGERSVDFPGGYQADSYEEHDHVIVANAKDHNGSGALVGGNNANFNDGTVKTQKSGSSETRGKNFGVFIHTRI